MMMNTSEIIIIFNDAHWPTTKSFKFALYPEVGIHFVKSAVVVCSFRPVSWLLAPFVLSPPLLLIPHVIIRVSFPHSYLQCHI